MSQSTLIWVVLLVTLLAANLPFMNERVFALFPLFVRAKPLAARFAEMVVLYLLAIGLGLLFERHLGQIAPQGWEFYAVTGALFIVLAFPGFTWRYLLKHRK